MSNTYVRLRNEPTDRAFNLRPSDLEPGMIVEWSTKEADELFLVVWKNDGELARLVKLNNPASTYSLTSINDKWFRRLPAGSTVTLEVIA